VIEYLLSHTKVPIHYITSDPDDIIFKIAEKEPRIKPYYIGEKRLITLMMKMDADVVVMTMPDLENYHIKRSYIRKDIDKYTRHYNYQHRVDSILLSYKTKTDIYRKSIEDDINKSIRKMNSEKLIKYMLKEYGYARNSRGIKSACIYESIDIKGQQNRTRDHQCNFFQSSHNRVCFQSALLPV
jgi:hypothetical protein